MGLRARGSIEAVGVVVPAKNEATHLPACVAALMRAAVALPIEVSVVIVLDTCTDGSHRVVGRLLGELGPSSGPARRRFDVIEVSVGNVGAARAVGMEALLASHDPETLWLACTDADSTVPERWLAAQLDRAAEGFDAVVGTVSINSHDHDYPAAVLARARAEYQKVELASNVDVPTTSASLVEHNHVHGANLGVRANAYRTAGGFPPLAEHEDVALVAALNRAGNRLAWVRDIPVTTSARRHGRTPRGFSGYLSELEVQATYSPTAATKSLN